MAEIEQKVDALLARMTVEEKIALCHAGSKFAVAANDRLGIPEFWMSDGPHGVRHEIERDSWEPVATDKDYATYLPTGTALAATWNPQRARQFGEVLGAEARARGKDIILGPGINIVRTPLCGRNFEYYGEDPYHISKMVVPAIEGIQSQDVAACVKHFAANSQELNRNGVDARMDERTLREIYLPGFKAAVVTAGVWTLMGAYNKFRGQHCCHHAYLLNDILKGEWAFDGTVISDWAGTYDTVEAAKNGLDLEMGTSRPYDEYYLARPFREAIQRGELDEALLDDKVRRNLRVMFRVGLFDPHSKPGELNSARHQQAALEIAREAIVLLKNDGNVLPLDKMTLRKLVVIGDNATAQHARGGNSSGVKALYEITPLAGLRNRLGNAVEIRHFRGYPPTRHEAETIRAEFLGTADEGAGTHGWKRRYFANRNFQGAPMESAEATVDFAWTELGDFTIFWETTLIPPQSGVYEFVLTGANHARLELDGEALIQCWPDGQEDVISKSMELETGRTYRLSVALKPHGSGRVHLGWVPPGSKREPENASELLRAVREADAVVFVGGMNHQYDVEGSDRQDMALHDGQNELLAQVLGLNPHTAVVMVGGSPVEMPWAADAPAIVQAWYAGMEGGNALADVLLGDVNPSGKLPITFPRSLQDTPAHRLGDYAAEVCDYKEGIFVGYRWYDAQEIAPLFPFGHGLSYTTFELANMRLEKDGDGLRVELDITNTGNRAGAEVVQIYVGQPECSVERPVRELKEFAKVTLQPAETRHVEIQLSREAFAFWNPEPNAWVVEASEFVIEAGVSSRQICCKETVWLK